jgi:hypothetical protein
LVNQSLGWNTAITPHQVPAAFCQKKLSTAPNKSKLVFKKNVMKIQRIAIAVTVFNLVIMSMLLAKLNIATAQTQPKKLQVLRGSGLEIVDSLGKIRASISFHEAVEKDGIIYPAGILLRLIDSKGQPSIKIDAAEDGAGISLSNELQGYVQILAKESGGLFKIKNADGKEQVIKP